ncbi:MAG: hypothetical protein J5884_06650, partial [Paludibacteraceae bacterium]|nr:hypothetical protein [Paludibacteraceae bacterium]
MKRLLSILSLVVLAFYASATTWYIRTDGLDGNDGRSWETAQGTIRLGIDNCSAGDTLVVEAGVYYEGIILKEGIIIIGGCTAYEAYSRNRSHTGKTILDGKGLSTRLITTEQDCVLPTTVEDFVLQNARHDQQGG